MRSTPDEVLIRRIANGDRLAMQVLYARYHVRVFRFVVRLVRDEATAEDVISEVGVRLAGPKVARRYRHGC
jgi:RNA polymerase sigma-70 factor, ECF subfamily